MTLEANSAPSALDQKGDKGTPLDEVELSKDTKQNLARICKKVKGKAAAPLVTQKT